MRVLKFGGASLAQADEVDTSCRAIAASAAEAPTVVVVSAAKGITDLLVRAPDAAVEGSGEVEQVLAELDARHRDVAEALVDDAERRGELLAFLEERGARLASVLRSIEVLGEVTPRSRDYVAAYGERLSSRMVAAVLASRGLDAVAVDGEDVLATDGAFTRGFPDLAGTRARCRTVLGPMLEAGKTPVVMGFVGAGPDGRPCTLGRGGTDLSASLIGASLGAAEVRFMKEVDGIMSADPRVVPAAQRLADLSYEEVAELSFFGAKVLHPVAIHPLREAGIPAIIRNVFDLARPGTRVGPARRPEDADEPPQGAGVKALTSIPEVAVVTVSGGGMQGVPGVAGRVFAATARAEVNVLMISQGSSEQAISFVVPTRDRAAALASLEAEFELELMKGRIQRIVCEDDMGVVAAVGDGMRGTPGIAGRIFSALGARKLNVHLIAQGSSERNISLVVPADQVAEATRVLHQACVEDA